MRGERDGEGDRDGEVEVEDEEEEDEEDEEEGLKLDADESARRSGLPSFVSGDVDSEEEKEEEEGDDDDDDEDSVGELDGVPRGELLLLLDSLMLLAPREERFWKDLRLRVRPDDAAAAEELASEVTSGGEEAIVADASTGEDGRLMGEEIPLPEPPPAAEPRDEDDREGGRLGEKEVEAVTMASWADPWGMVSPSARATTATRSCSEKEKVRMTEEEEEEEPLWSAEEISSALYRFIASSTYSMLS